MSWKNYLILLFTFCQVDCGAVVGGPLIDLPDEMGWWLSIYVNMTIPFDGQIHRWQTVGTNGYGGGLGPVYPSVWRPKDNGTFVLVGYNSIQITQHIIETHDVAMAKQIHVKKDDVLGHLAASSANSVGQRGLLQRESVSDGQTSVAPEETLSICRIGPVSELTVRGIENYVFTPAPEDQNFGTKSTAAFQTSIERKYFQNKEYGCRYTFTHNNIQIYYE